MVGSGFQRVGYLYPDPKPWFYTVRARSTKIGGEGRGKRGPSPAPPPSSPATIKKGGERALPNIYSLSLPLSPYSFLCLSVCRRIPPPLFPAHRVLVEIEILAIRKLFD